LNYYEKIAYFNSGDRRFIIEKGFQEWLLAVIIGTPAKAAAAGCLNISVPCPGPRISDLVILIANLIGGIADEPV